MSSIPAPIRVLAVDDHPLLREGVIGLISNQPDFVMVGEASTGQEAIEQHRLVRPDITLMDLQMPDMSGVEAISAIRSEAPDARIIVLTTFAGDIWAERALKAGAQAYVLKNSVRKELLATMRAVHQGHKRIQSDVATQLAHHMSYASLTPREVEVLALIAQGNSNRAVGDALFVNEVTIKGHVKNILAKLGASDRTHAVTIGLRRGIIQL
ncbi:MAG: response regulator transcription factor [Steroidobacteraceae bacterium]